jgi:hypothetical protein
MIKEMLGFDYLLDEDDLKAIVDQFEMRPADQVHFYDLLSRPDFQVALINDLTSKLKGDLKYGMGNEQSIVYIIIAKKGRGKTTLAKIIVTMGGHEYKIVWSLTDILEQLHTSCPPPHFTFILDDPLILSGDASKKIKEEFANVNQLCRQFSVNFISNTKYFKPLENVDIFLELGGIKKKTGETRCFWRSDTGKYLGYVILKKTFTEEEFQSSNNEKVETWESLIEHEGSFNAINQNNLLDKIMEDIEQNHRDAELEDVSDIKFFLSGKAHLTMRMIDLLARQVMKRLERKDHKGREIKLSTDEFSLIETESLNPEVLEPMVATLPFAEKDQAVISLLIVEGLKTTDALQRLKDNRFKDSRFTTPLHISHFYQLKAKEIGIAMENRYAIMHPEYEHQGGPNKPDFLFPQKQQVIAFKSVLAPEGVKKQMIDIKVEWEKAKELGWELWCFVCCFRTREIYYYKYEGGSA